MVLGKLLADLKKNKLAESTLVLVVGDHGEAFGRHDQISHGRKIYEENLHVPCIMIHPSLKGESINTVGGLVDIAPTLASLMNLKAPEGWLGTDLFSSSHPNRAFFFAPWSDYLFGYREGNRKYIFNATKNHTEIYDLDLDPQETKNLAELYPQDVVTAHYRLAAWTQYVNKNIEKITSGNKNEVALGAR